jgi:hypothetical protein
MRAKNAGALLLLYELARGKKRYLRQHEIVEATARDDFGDKVPRFYRHILIRARQTRFSVPVDSLESAFKTIGNDVVLFRALLGNDRFDRSPERLPVTARAGPH